MIEIILIVIVAAVLFVVPALIIRALARKPFYWTFTPANTFSLVVTEEDSSGDGMKGGGNIVDVLHAVPGKRLVKEGSDNMNWVFIPGEDSDHGFLFRTLGVQSMGSIFRTTRVNLEQRTRYTREQGTSSDKSPEARATSTEELHDVTKWKKSRSVFYTGELTIIVKEADTADRLGVNFKIDLIFARQCPVRSVLRLADTPAFLDSLTQKVVNSETSTRNAEDYIGGPHTKTNRDNLITSIKNDIKVEALKELGLEITSVSLRDVSMTDDQRKFLELKMQAEKTAEAKVITAGGERDAQIALNTSDADRVERVIKPAAENDRTVLARFADALENNKTLTSITYAPGASTMLPLSK